MKIGYARVSTADQNLDLQISALEKAGCNKIYREKQSGAAAARPVLEKCLASLSEGDVLIVWRLDRLGRSMKHLVDIITDLKEREIAFRSLMDGAIDTTTASGTLIFNIFAALAQFERQLIQERVNAGLSAARARGRLGGRPKVEPTSGKVQTAKQMYENKSMGIEDICEALDISRATFYRYLKM